MLGLGMFSGRRSCMLQGNRTYQLSHLVKPTDVVYPTVWTRPGAEAEGLWMPSFWTRVSFGITDLDAKNLVTLLEVCPLCLKAALQSNP